jgi:hypothetical protein
VPVSCWLASSPLQAVHRRPRNRRRSCGAGGERGRAGARGSDRPRAAPGSGPAAASEPGGSPGNTAAAATTEPLRTVEVAKLADANPVTCRDMLVQGSNHSACNADAND